MHRNCINCFTSVGADGFCPHCGFQNASYVPEPHHLPPEMTLHGRYMIGRALGEGGFGITYAGYDLVLDRKVAVKEYFPSGAVWRDRNTSMNVTCYTSQNFRQTFETGRQKCIHEAKSLARLDDIPGVVRILDFFGENNTSYIVMEFVEGVTLKAYASQLQQRLTMPQILQLLRPVTDALDTMHSRGFVHRDISPDNIMVAYNGQVKLLDFGAVKAVTGGGSATENPIVKRGFSPTELYSTSGLIGPWTDIYSIAATIVFLLTGFVPDEPTDRMQHDSLPQRLDGVCTDWQKTALLRALSVQSDHRQRSLSELMRELETQSVSYNPPAAPQMIESDVKTQPLYRTTYPSETPDSDPNYQRTQRLSDRDAGASNIPAKNNSPKKKDTGLKIAALALIAVLIAVGVIWITHDASEPEVAETETSTSASVKTTEAELNSTIAAKRDGLLSAGWLHTVGVRKDGRLYVTVYSGDSDYNYGQFDVGTWTNITAVETGLWHTVGLRKDGTVVACGDSLNGQCDVTDWTDIVAVSAAWGHTVGLRKDGTVVATRFTGDSKDYHGQCATGTWTDIVAISAGEYHTVGLRKDGTVVAAGMQDSGRCSVSGWKDIVAISAGTWNTVGLRKDGTVIATGENFEGQCNVGSWTDIVAIAAGSNHTVGLRSDGTVVSTKYIYYENARYIYSGQCDVDEWRNLMLPEDRDK